MILLTYSLLKKISKAVGLIILLLFVSGCKEVILHNLSEERVNRARLVLSEHDIPADKTNTGGSWNLSVPSDDVTRALKVIEENRLLPIKREYQEQASSSFVLSKEERLMLRERRIAGALEETLLRVPDVLEARVHLFLEARSSFAMRQKSNTESASVLLVAREVAEIDPRLVKNLVAGASGVPEKKISVLVSRKSPQIVSPLSKARVSKVEPPSGEKTRAAVGMSYEKLYKISVPAILVIIVLAMAVRVRLRNEKTKAAKKQEPLVEDAVTLTPPAANRNGTLWQEEAY